MQEKKHVKDVSPVMTASEVCGAVRRGEGGKACEYAESAIDAASFIDVA
jgi:hypothetical protein